LSKVHAERYEPRTGRYKRWTERYKRWTERYMPGTERDAESLRTIAVSDVKVVGMGEPIPSTGECVRN
jgi:hypothetical protein